MLYQHLSAPNDKNGNPRRVWVVYNEVGNISAVHDESYGNLPAYLRSEGQQLAGFDISTSQYLRLVRSVRV
jgi:hypothetical protein